MVHRVTRYHDISAGHRVTGHESKCRHLHGHNYRIHFTCEAKPTAEMTFAELDHHNEGYELDELGRVIDFGVVKEKLCMWVENNWDHKFLAWEHDPVITMLCAASSEYMTTQNHELFGESLVRTPFNPTAENMAQYLVEVIGPQQLAGTGVKLVSVRIEETAKCSAEFSL